jgi:transcriptional regulator with GAF, ATPase, and Fis domain
VDTLREAVGDLYDVVAVENEAQLAELLVNGPVGLALVGNAPAPSPGDLSARLRRALEALGAHGQPTLIYCGEKPDTAAQSLIARTRNLVYSQWPLSALELRTIARRCVESHALGVENDRLTSELEGSVERLRRENSYLRGRAAAAQLEGIVGDSERMRRVYALVENVAPLHTTVMIVGETGTGKELIARAIHARSERSGKPFIVQNCAAVPETLLDTELFGHVRGAFTGAIADREGLFESASGGTIFLDEIGEMTAGMQAKLLRVLQDGEVRRIGSTRTTHVDVRVLCATHRDLAALVREHRFREDLYYRLRSFIVALPPLRERRGDIPVLASHFLARFAQRHKRSVAGLTEDALRLLEEHSWPGNVRELEHTLERLVVMCPPGGKVSAALVREALRLAAPGIEAAQGELGGRGIDDVLRDYERQIITEELARAGGVLAAAARALGVDRSTLSKRCKRLGLRGTEISKA